mmetsp:Transcript_16974/g.44202  ORF Transcript_16974/g.44202 Transcript_16974/m.44202 type:complete len:329 (-) Transcript_16974:44-1030(-)
MVLFGWQALQLYTNYTNLLTAQIEQARRVKQRYPTKPTFVYLPIVDAQPYYATEKPIFTDEQYHDFLFRAEDGSLYGPTTHHKCAGAPVPDCICAQWNFFNKSARDFFIENATLSLVTADPHNDAFDGVFFDAAAAFLRGKWGGAANAPANPGPDEVMAIEVELMRRVVTAADDHGKYPMFNIHYSDMNVANNRTQAIMGAIGGAGMFRFYETHQMLTVDFVANAVAERSIELYTLFCVPVGPDFIDKLAVFLLVRGEHYYFGYHTSYLDGGWAWHPEFDVDYGLPITGPKLSQQPGGVAVYTRNYTKCAVRVVCGVGGSCGGTIELN